MTGPQVRIREVREGDEGAIRELLSGLDPESRHRRWFTGAISLPRVVDWAAHPDRFGAFALLAFAGEEPAGHGVLVPCGDGRAEIAFEVAAAWRRRGIASSLLGRLLDAGQDRGLHEVYAEVLCANADMLAVLREHPGGPHRESRDAGVVTVTLPVAPRAARARPARAARSMV